jgi:hypothetical protein
MAVPAPHVEASDTRQVYHSAKKMPAVHLSGVTHSPLPVCDIPAQKQRAGAIVAWRRGGSNKNGRQASRWLVRLGGHIAGNEV